jgi:DNA polymerase III epsilon subunit-like protein
MIADQPLFGSAKQVRWVRRIQADLRDRYPHQPLPDSPFASFWIDHRSDEYPDLLAAASEELRHSQFSSTYPRYGRDEALATLALLDRGDFLVVDNETTGVRKTDQITDIAVVSRDESVLLQSFIKPTNLDGYADSAAESVTGLTADVLRDAPTFTDLWPQLSPLLYGVSPVLAYNSAFDGPMIRRSARAVGIQAPPLVLVCAMKLFSGFVGSDDNFKLVEAVRMAGIDLIDAHTARGDALATVKLVNWMIGQRQFRSIDETTGLYNVRTPGQ